MDACGRRWVKTLEDAVQNGRPTGFRFLEQAIAQAGGALRTGKQALKQGTKIEACAAGDDREPGPAGNVCDDGAGGARVVPGGLEGVRRNHIQQVV